MLLSVSKAVKHGEAYVPSVVVQRYPESLLAVGTCLRRMDARVFVAFYESISLLCMVAKQHHTVLSTMAEIAECMPKVIQLVNTNNFSKVNIPLMQVSDKSEIELIAYLSKTLDDRFTLVRKPL